MKPKIEQLDTDQLHSSPTNPRGDQVLKADDLRDLVESIRQHGVLDTVLVRPAGQGYEIIKGHRRVAAARLAGLTRVPCEVRDLTDVEVVELQLVELAQRADVDPLAEAKAYETLKAMCHGDVAEVALRVGKSRRHVYGRLALARVIPEIVTKHREGGWELGALQALGGLEPEQQLKVYEQAQHWAHLDDVGARRAIERYVLLDLAAAPFDTADTRLPGGPCAKCPKRTGSQPDLFGHISDKSEMCLDASCFASKKEAAWEWKCKEAKDAGQKVLTAKETKGVFSEPDYGPTIVKKSSGYVELNDPCLEDPRRRTYAQLLGKKVQVTLARDSKGVTHELVELTKDVKKALADKTPKAKPEPKAAEHQGDEGDYMAPLPTSKPQPAQASAEGKVETELLRVLYRRGRQAFVPKPGTMWPVGPEWFRSLLEIYRDLSIDTEDVLAECLSVGGQDIQDVQAELELVQSEAHLACLLTIVAHVPCVGRKHWAKGVFERTCIALKLDPKAVELEAAAIVAAGPQDQLEAAAQAVKAALEGGAQPDSAQVEQLVGAFKERADEASKPTKPKKGKAKASKEAAR